MKIVRPEIMLAVIAAATIAAPALAHCRGTPAPVAGLGYGAVLAVGAGYRALKRSIGR